MDMLLNSGKGTVLGAILRVAVQAMPEIPFTEFVSQMLSGA